MQSISHLVTKITSLSALFSLSLTASIYASSNPLATKEQFELDKKAINIFQQHTFKALRLNAIATYTLAYAGFVSDEAKPLLKPMVGELVFSAIQKSVNSDPYYPKVYWVNTGPRQWFDTSVPGGRYSYDNPDVIYRIIPIKGDLHYVLHGVRDSNGLADATFSLISNPNSQGTVAVLTNKDLVVNADGTYDITIDDQPANGRINHIQSTDAVVQLYVRNSLGDWLNQKPDQLSIELLDDTSCHEPKSDLSIYWDTVKNLGQSIFFYGTGALGIKTKINAVNTFKQPVQSDDLGTLVTQASSFGHFRIQEDEALLITINPGGANYFVVPATNPWTITIDPGNNLCSFNNAQSAQDSDGNYRYVVSKVDPGVYNWVSTGGLHEGTMMLRWQNLPQTSPASGAASVTTELLKLDALPAKLPASTRWVSVAERQKQLADRLSGYQLRSVY